MYYTIRKDVPLSRCSYRNKDVSHYKRHGIEVNVGYRLVLNTFPKGSEIGNTYMSVRSINYNHHRYWHYDSIRYNVSYSIRLTKHNHEKHHSLYWRSWIRIVPTVQADPE